LPDRDRAGVRTLARKLGLADRPAGAHQPHGPVVGLRLGEFDTRELEAADRRRAGLAGVPMRVGVNRPLPGGKASIETAGRWAVAGDMEVGHLQIEVVGAKAVRAHFSRFSLPAGGRLLVYGQKPEDFDVYVRNGPTGKGAFWASAVTGNVVHIEYQAPRGASRRPTIEIDQVSHLYRDSSADPIRATPGNLVPMDTHTLQNLLTCEEDVNCFIPLVQPPAPDTPAVIARKSVGRIEFTDNGETYFCSGVLLNDADDNTWAGYLLTANHCLGTQEAVDSMTVYWFYEYDDQTYNFGTCTGTTFPSLSALPKSIGGTLLATSPTTDFTFIRLTDDPHDGQGFAGYRTTNDVQAGDKLVGVHHPQGGLKRYSEGALSTGGPICVDPASYWFLDWTIGITETGSSGSPLFLVRDGGNTWEVVGQLMGACVAEGETVGCNNPQDYDITYGKFGVTYPSIQTWLTQTTPDDEHEDDDSPGQARPLCRGTHALKLVDFEDYFRVDAPRAGQVSAVVTYDPSEVNLAIQLLELDETVIAESETGSGADWVGASLPAGSYLIRACKTHKWGGDYALTVGLPPGYSDFDRDGDVDSDDFGHLQRCFSGLAPQSDPSCFDASLNDDGRVDSADLLIFDGCYSGPNVPAAAGCAP